VTRTPRRGSPALLEVGRSWRFLRRKMSVKLTLEEELIEVLESLYELCLNGDFRNGVTDSSGTMDEGDVKAGERIDRARELLIKVGRAV
jgi:hypothetical protein